MKKCRSPHRIKRGGGEKIDLSDCLLLFYHKRTKKSISFDKNLPKAGAKGKSMEKTQKSKESNTSNCSLLLQTLCSQLSFKVCNVGQGKGWGTASLISTSWLIVQFQSQFLRNAGGSGLGMIGTRQEWGKPLFS